jgi:cell wall-associated NlpC family hydrolase
MLILSVLIPIVAVGVFNAIRRHGKSHRGRVSWARGNPQGLHRAPDPTTMTAIRHHSPAAGIATIAAIATPAHGILLTDKVTASPTATFNDLVSPEPPFHKLIDPIPQPVVAKHKTIAQRKNVAHHAKHIFHRKPKPISVPQVHKAPALKTVHNLTPTHGISVGKWATVLGALKSQLGVPYVYGGETPGRGFDCSGLTQWAFGQAGIHLPRTSEAQGQSGYGVRSPKPGDLVAYGGHVGVYIGGGQMIAAPHTGDVVKIESVYGSPWYRRVL